MACKEETIVIEDAEGETHSYFIRQLPADRGLVMKYRLAKVLGGGLAELGKVAGVEDTGKQLEGLANVVTELFKEVEPEDMVNLIKDILAEAKRDKQRITGDNFNKFYNNNYVEMYKAVAAVIKVNYGDFFKGSQLMAGSLIAEKAEA